MVRVANLSGSAKDLKDQVLVLRMSILHTLQPRGTFAMANFWSKYHGSQFLYQPKIRDDFK